MAGLSPTVKRSKAYNQVFAVLAMLTLLGVVFVLGSLLWNLVSTGGARIDASFFTNFPSRFAARAGILSAWVGSLLVILVTAAVAIPIGIGAAIYLEEYAKKNWLSSIIEINIANLAGVPSIVWGLMALGLFIYNFNFGRSILTAGLTLGLLILPIIIVTTRESIRAIPVAIREASYALGSSKWQTIRDHLIPYSMGGILTGMIIALSRAIGETAPLITIGALTFIAFLPDSPISGEFPYVNFHWLHSEFAVLPIQMFNWVTRPQEDFHINAAAAGLVLVVLTLTMNGVAIIVRSRYRRRIRW